MVSRGNASQITRLYQLRLLLLCWLSCCAVASLPELLEAVARLVVKFLILIGLGDFTFSCLVQNLKQLGTSWLA